MALSRAQLSVLTINRYKYNWWSEHLLQNYPTIHAEMEAIYNEISFLLPVDDLIRHGHMVPRVAKDKKYIQDLVIHEVKKRKLKIEYGLYDKLTYNDILEIQIYISKQSASWTLNKQTLTELYGHFKATIDVDALKRVCFLFGYDYQPYIYE